jgi:hypothetical protein
MSALLRWPFLNLDRYSVANRQEIKNIPRISFDVERQRVSKSDLIIIILVSIGLNIHNRFRVNACISDMHIELQMFDNLHASTQSSLGALLSYMFTNSVETRYSMWMEDTSNGN